ncbi:MAG: tetratricopeptide repeat protein [Myxococcales bacterium]|nr:tetratricopeptide repeat protein [Myxococcales bacterium]
MILLLALLIAAPERVVIVARPKTEKSSFFHRMAEATHRLYEKEDPDVAQGNALVAQGEPENALKEYDKAHERLPDSPALSLDRAATLLKLDPSKAPEAASEAGQAMQRSDGKLKAQAAYDLALATEAMGRPDDAMKAYAAALALDPDDVDAKVNLELLLKTQEERKQKQQQQQPQESKENKQNQQQQQPDKAKGEEQQKQQQKEAGDKNQEQQQQQQPQQAKQQEKKQPQPEEQKPVDRSEAERLLDALRAGEKNLQVWRFAKEKRKEARRGDVEKDW